MSQPQVLTSPPASIGLEHARSIRTRTHWKPGFASRWRGGEQGKAPRFYERIIRALSLQSCKWDRGPVKKKRGQVYALLLFSSLRQILKGWRMKI